METEVLTPHSPLVVSLLRGETEFRSPTSVVIERIFARKLKFLGVTIEGEGDVIDIESQEPVSL